MEAVGSHHDPLERLGGRGELRLGLMGGTFDPIHVGHLVAAEEALRQFALDEIVFLPTGTAPHKLHPITPAELRYSLTVVATSGNPHFWVSRLEVERPGPAYTVESLTRIQELLPGSVLYLITGADAILDLLSWKDPDRLLALASIIAATRPGYDLDRLAGILEALPSNALVEVMEMPGLAVSSSSIRERVRQGRSIRYLVPDGVRELVEKWGLYREAAPGGGPA